MSDISNNIRQLEITETRRVTRESEKAANLTANTDIDTLKIAQEFMGNFDPETSLRERKKLNRKLTTTSKRYANALYDERGVHLKSGKDVCDCLQEKCPGCFFPCPKCRVRKCAGECRNLRKFVYDSVEFEGSDYKIKNPYSMTK